jgi:drug/metabolite transporter (DMT)-like permease
MPTPSPRRGLAPVLLVLLGAVWGTSFVLMKVGLFARDGSALLRPLDLAAWRIGCASILLVLLFGRRLRLLTRTQWLWAGVVGIVGSTIPAALFATAQTQLPSAVAGMLNALSPLWTLLLSVVAFRRPVRRLQLIGVLVGLAGAVLLVTRSHGGPTPDADAGSPWAALLVVVATACYGVSVNVTREKLGGIDASAMTTASLLWALIPCTLVVATGDLPATAAHHPDGLRAIAAITLLGAVGTAGALAVFNRVVQWTDAVTASSVTYIIPIFATLWGLAGGEPLLPGHFVASGLILVGVAIAHADLYRRSGGKVDT